MSQINVDHIAKERWGPPLADADWHAFCQASYKGKEKIGRQLYDAHKEMSRAVVVKKPQEAQKAKAPLEAGEEHHDQRVKTTSWEKQDKISTLGRVPQKSNCCTG